MRYTFLPIFPAIALLSTLLVFLTGPRTRTSMIFFGLMVLVCVAAIIYLSYLAYAPRAKAKVWKGTRCPVCYAKLDKESGFCPKCGNVVDPSKGAALTRCPKCGFDIDEPDRDFCPRCGSMLKK